MEGGAGSPSTASPPCHGAASGLKNSPPATGETQGPIFHHQSPFLVRPALRSAAPHTRSPPWDFFPYPTVQPSLLNSYPNFQGKFVFRQKAGISPCPRQHRVALLNTTGVCRSQDSPPFSASPKITLRAGREGPRLPRGSIGHGWRREDGSRSTEQLTQSRTVPRGNGRRSHSRGWVRGRARRFVHPSLAERLWGLSREVALGPKQLQLRVPLHTKLNHSGTPSDVLATPCAAAWDGFQTAVPGRGALLLAAHTHYPSHIHQLSLHHPQGDQKRSPAPSAAFPAQRRAVLRSLLQASPFRATLPLVARTEGTVRGFHSGSTAPQTTWLLGWKGMELPTSCPCSAATHVHGQGLEQAGCQTATQDQGSHLQRPFGQLAGPRGGWSWQRGGTATCRSQRDIAAATGESPVVSSKPRVRVCHRDVSKTLQMLPQAAAQTVGQAPWDLVSAAGRVWSCLAPCQSLQGPWGGGSGGSGGSGPRIPAKGPARCQPRASRSANAPPDSAHQPLHK